MAGFAPCLVYEPTSHTDVPEFEAIGSLAKVVPRPWVLVFDRRSRIRARILGGPLLGSLIGFGWAALALPQQYESSATLLRAPLPYSSSLRARPLSLLGYYRLLESDAVLWTAIQDLRRQQILEPEESLRRGRDIESSIYLSWRTEETVLAPLIEIKARGDDPEEAAAIANALAHAFLEQNRELALNSTRPTLDLLAEQFARCRADLKELSRRRREAMDRFQSLLDDLEMHWDRRIAETERSWNRRLLDHRKKTMDLVVGCQTESRRAIERFASDRGISASDPSPAPALLEAGELPRFDLPNENPGIQDQLEKIVVLRALLAQTPQILQLERAVSDDGLWKAAALAQTGLVDVRSLWTKKLLMEVPNPLYTGLSLPLAELEESLDLSDPSLRRWAMDVLSGLERLQRKRSASFAQLLADRALLHSEMESRRRLELDQLRRRKAEELDALRRRWRARIEGIDRDLDQAKVAFEELGASFNQAQLALSAEGLEDIRLGSPAIPPIQPVATAAGLRVLAGAIVGFSLGWALSRPKERRVTVRGGCNHGDLS